MKDKWTYNKEENTITFLNGSINERYGYVLRNYPLVVVAYNNGQFEIKIKNKRDSMITILQADSIPRELTELLRNMYEIEQEKNKKSDNSFGSFKPYLQVYNFLENNGFIASQDDLLEVIRLSGEASKELNDFEFEDGNTKIKESDVLEKDTEQYEYVNSPSHYNNFSVEVIDMMEAIWGKEKLATFCEMNAFKYRMRIGDKEGNDPLQELKKAKWYENKFKELNEEK